MMTTSNNHNSDIESARLKALHRYETLVDGVRKEIVFDRLAALAAQICGVPIAYIKLITDDSQYTKAAYGAEWTDKPDKLGICNHTIQQDRILEIKDSDEHELFEKDQDLRERWGRRFYAGVPLKTPDGHNIGTLCLMDDKPGSLSDSQKEALKTLSDEIISRYELNRIRDELAKKNEEKDELIKIVSHDIRNPLAGIINYSGLLIELLTDEELLEMARIIEKGGETILSVVNLMLDSDEVRNRAFIIRRTETDVAKSIRKLSDLYRKSIARKNQKLIVEIPDQLIVEIDKDKWEQIVGNLLSNAIRFTGDGGSIKIRLETNFKIKKLLDITVSDTGIGMPQDILDDIYTGRDSIMRECTEGKKSSGFGMFITKKYVQLMNGMISVSSQVGEGSEVKVRIPI